MDQILDLVTEPAAAFGTEMARRQEETAADLFNEGGRIAGNREVFDNSVGRGQIEQDQFPAFIYDGKPFFALAGNEHVSAGGGLYANHLPNVLTAPNVDLAMQQVEDDNAFDELDRRISNPVNTLLVPTALRQTAETIVENNNIPEPGTGLTNFNPRNRLELRVWSFLTNPAAWFVGRRQRGIRYYRGGAPTVKFAERLENNSLMVMVQGTWGYNVRDFRPWQANNLPT